MGDILETLAVVATSLGGLELVKWAFNIGSYRRNQSAQAEMSELEAERLEVTVMKENITFLQEQLNSRNEEIAEKNELLRKQNEDILKLTSDNVLLKTERSIKLCEIRGCDHRDPQSGY